MNRILARLLGFNLTLLLAIAGVGVQIQSAAAEGTPANIAAALAYPTSSQRFFDQGHQQFETEIHSLRQQALPQPPVLTIDSDVEQQQQLWQQQQDQQLEEILRQPADRQHKSYPL